jgi:hypothetical protein
MPIPLRCKNVERDFLFGNDWCFGGYGALSAKDILVDIN